MKRWMVAFIACMGLVSTAGAQYDAQLSQYFMAMGYYNPAYAGSSGELNVVGLQRRQWVGIPGAPVTTFINVEMPLRIENTQTGIGAVLTTETIGLFNNSQFAAQFAYKHRLWGGTLSLGLQAGIASISFDGTQANPGETEEQQQEDAAIPRTLINGTAFDLNAGLYYTHRHFYLGLATTHFLEPQLDLEENISTYIGRAYNLTGGYNIQLKNPLFEVQPSVFVKTDLQSFQADLSTRVVYNKMFSGGLSWRGYEWVVFLGAAFSNIEVGYAYDLPTGALLKASSGSHELMIRYKMKLDKAKTGNYRHKSVRIL